MEDMSASNEEAFHDLTYYTMSHPDMGYFIHQHMVDVYHAQNASESTKPIQLVFALIGLYLYLEKNYTGRQVQLAHMTLAQNKKDWPKIELPENRGNITIHTVLNTKPGPERDSMIKFWCTIVWQTFKSEHKTIISLSEGV
jgi:Family of unknown function (DUF5946)